MQRLNSFRRFQVFVACAVLLLAAALALAAEEEKKPATASAAKSKVRVAGKEDFEKLLEKHRGKVVFVNYWATWCDACLEHLPHTMELARKLGKSGLVVVTVSLDDSEEKDAVLEILGEHKAKTTNLMSKHGADEESYVEFELTAGELPYYKLYGRDGKLAREFASGDPVGKPFKIEEIDVAIRELLAKKADNAPTP